MEGFANCYSSSWGIRDKAAPADPPGTGTTGWGGTVEISPSSNESDKPKSPSEGGAGESPHSPNSPPSSDDNDPDRKPQTGEDPKPDAGDTAHPVIPDAAMNPPGTTDHDGPECQSYGCTSPADILAIYQYVQSEIANPKPGNPLAMDREDMIQLKRQIENQIALGHVPGRDFIVAVPGFKSLPRAHP